MISTVEGPVPVEAARCAVAVPAAFVRTWTWRHFWANCEDGVRSPPFWFPGVEDVVRMLTE